MEGWGRHGRLAHHFLLHLQLIYICTRTQKGDGPIDNTNYRPGDTPCGGLRTKRAQLKYSSATTVTRTRARGDFARRPSLVLAGVAVGVELVDEARVLVEATGRTG